jgi:flagellar basal-body rod protein FlgB
MLSKITDALNLQSQALKLRGQRQGVLTSNITNADTPGYKAVDFDFAKALESATAATRTLPVSGEASASLARTDGRHIEARRLGADPSAMSLKFRSVVMPSIDGNTVDLETERAQFAENALKYEASLRALNGQLRTLQSAMSGNSGQ